MKCRNGFVSNSSSSSFVIIGFEMTRDEVEEHFKTYAKNHNIIIESEDDLDDLIYEKLSEQGYMYDGERDNPIIGLYLASSDIYLEEKSYNMDEINEKIEQVKKDFDLSGTDIKLITGEASC